MNGGAGLRPPGQHVADRRGDVGVDVQVVGQVPLGVEIDCQDVQADPLQDVSNRPHGRRLAGAALLRQDRDRRRHLRADYSLAVGLDR